MRVRIRELMAAIKASPLMRWRRRQRGGSASLGPTAWPRAEGTFASITPEVLEALCEVLEVEPGELLERARRSSRPRG